MGYRGDAIKGSFWLGGFRVSSRAIAFARTFILARILTPSQFGVYGIATLVLSFLEIITETGINVVLIQEKDNTESYINTAWVVSIIRGIVISSALFLAAPFIALFFNSPDAQTIVQLTALVPLIRGFINPAEVMFQKQLAFSKEFFFRLTIYTTDTLAATVLAIVYKTPLALIGGLIIGAVLEVVLSFIVVKPRPVFEFNKKKFSHVISRGKWMSAAGVFQYLFREGDDVVVGRMLGTGPLGLYQVVYSLATLPISEVADVLGKVTLPIYVNIAHDKKRLKRAYLATTGVLMALVIPGTLALIIFAEPIIRIALGEQWVAGAPALQFLAVYAFLRTTINPILTVLLAVKDQRAVSFVTLINTITLAAVIFPLTFLYGIEGTAVSTIIAVIPGIPLSYVLARKYLK